ncbi:tyrosine-type recombinase/integrase [Isoptericola cucumis]|uniref:Tyr recombinase domain-containing protein n=1 Tax=Isoptericola cucumis TaxID=1776856 RepID=A0ABQ2B414_9MICO|nr:tyrosine-type recombinase/integrase [Isoptericola cucumis]GGI07316.1 hypothetical protein GCM10007368_15560 [Isoptericola cucumis]
MLETPGSVPMRLTGAANVPLLRAELQVFEAMLAGWRNQMLARGLTVATIKSRNRVVERFQEFTNDFPWSWQASDLDEYFAERRSGGRTLALTTLRAESNAIAMFCSFICDGRYGWATLCEQRFGDLPSQIVFEWNTPRHKTDDAVGPGRRAFVIDELQRFFDTVDDFVDAHHHARSKTWLTAMRDSMAFKVCYAYGLRRRELVMLDVTDFGPNPHVPDYGRFGAITVRWAKGMAGTGPRRRTVLTTPQFDWVTSVLQTWHSPGGRDQFATAARSDALWPSERGDRITMSGLGRSFARFRDLAGLPEELSLHALRHSYVTHLIEAGYDPLFVQQQVGHSYSSTTALYTSVSSDYKQKVVQRMIAQRMRTRTGEPDE